MRPALKEARERLKGNNNLVIAEIGVLRGENAREILSEWNEVETLYLIDNFCCGWNEFETAKKIIYPWEDRCIWKIQDSVEAINDIEDDLLDCVYIDGDHSYEGVKRDILASWKKLKIGGVLAGHDYQKRWKSLEGAVKAVDEFVAENKLELWSATTGSSSDWVISKL
uniref:Putative methyltransferase n=1 Tax=viral metagenome TaxID=1070528 RepID=A0A6M3JDY1_9ZZZZ